MDSGISTRKLLVFGDACGPSIFNPCWTTLNAELSKLFGYEEDSNAYFVRSYKVTVAKSQMATHTMKLLSKL